MFFSGVQKTSLINYPGFIATVLFTTGCNFRCKYCYNKDLVCSAADNNNQISESEVFEILNQRLKFIDAVVITGGEPTIQPDLINFMTKLRENFSLKIKLDTNGFQPDVVSLLIKNNLVDYLAIDIKTSPSKYKELINQNVDINLLKKNIKQIKNSKVAYELRSTIIPGFFNKSDIDEISKITGNIQTYNLQQYVNENTLDSAFKNLYPVTKDELIEIQKYILTFAHSCSIRGI
jgi:pyruvate formate lyase activating enzyme